jgi:hypothetical protein
MGGIDPNPTTEKKKLRILFSTTSDPMALYTLLKSTGKLTHVECHAILFNPNLTAYTDICAIASENCMPASFVIAKLMRLKNQPLTNFDQWIHKVPSIPSLWQFVQDIVVNKRETKRGRNPKAMDDARRSLRLAQTDLTAHLSYIIKAQGINAGFAVWKKWVYSDTVSKKAKHLVLQLPSMQLLTKSRRDPIALNVVRAVLDFDDGGFRLLTRQPTIDLLANLRATSPAGSALPFELAARVLKLSQDCFTPTEVADLSAQVVSEWIAAQDFSGQADKAKRYLSWAISQNRFADMYVRARLERLKEEMEHIDEEKENLGTWSAIVHV